MSILVSAGIHREGFIIVLEGPTYGRRDDLHRMGFQYTEPGGYWYSFFDMKTLTILESWPEVRLTVKAANIAHRIEEAKRKREPARKAADIRAFVNHSLVKAAGS